MNAANSTPVHDDRRTTVVARMLRDPRSVLGTVAVVLVVVPAVVGPHLATRDPEEFAGAPLLGPAAGHLLGTDILGRDVLTRLLAGGQTFIIQGALATLIGVTLGAGVGIAMAMLSRRASELLLSVNDTFIVIPQILVSLLVITRFGATPPVLVAVVALSHVAHTARVARAATSHVASSDYVLAAAGIGLSRRRIAAHELLPNVLPVLLVELGVRLAASFVLLASLNFLGFGSSGLEWGRMIEENKGGLAVQPLAVMAPVLVMAVFLIGMNLVRDGASRALAARSAR
ncbi:ABC transporter permease [Acrocarpospora catenulata]|uniref:ABC transporter permease n=1 Tax=Acrocarpospora catenulata TaxID=2836182 RepID=UPI001BDA0AAC|nr:ABC transporter permease subunit [Acrocarpospora catenulata]